jgi:hypothetical protein
MKPGNLASSGATPIRRNRWLLAAAALLEAGWIGGLLVLALLR